VPPTTQCAKCGACAPVCPVFQITGRESHTARGKLHLQKTLAPAKASKGYSEILSLCLLCGACEAVCSRRIDITGLVITARSRLPRLSGPSPIKKNLIRQALKRPGFFTRLARTGARLNRTLAALLPEQSGLRLAPDLLDDRLWPLPPAGRNYVATVSRPSAANDAPTVSYFSGCLANFLAPEIGRATEYLLDKTGQRINVPNTQACCGLAFHAAGHSLDAIELAKKNITAFSDRDLPILTSCASCYAHLRNYPNLLAADRQWRSRADAFVGRLQEFNTYFLSRTDLPAQLTGMTPSAPGRAERLVYHDPCHLRFHCKITLAPRKLLTGIPGIELCELAGGPKCCGQGGLFGLLHPELSQSIFIQLKADLDTIKADVVVTTCSGCLLKLRKGLADEQPLIKVTHPALLIAANLP